MADPVKLSSKTALTPLLPFDRVAVVRRALDEPDASKRVFPATLPDAARAIGPVLPGPNFIPGAPKFARFKTQAQVTAAGAFGGNALDSIPGLLWCLLCPGTVEFDTDGQRNVTYIPVYDGVARPAESPGFIVYRTGEFVAGDTIPAKLVRLASPEAGVVAYAERPATYAWAVGELTRAYVAGTVPELFFKRKAPGGVAPAPSNAAGDANWEVVAREAVPPPPAPIKLYASTGQDTDGAMTRKAATNAFGLRAVYNLVGSGSPLAYDDFNAAADASTGETFILNRAFFTLTSAANIGTTWLIGNAATIALNGFSFICTNVNVLNVVFSATAATPLFRLDFGTLSNCVLPDPVTVTINGVLVLDNCGTVRCAFAGTGSIILRNGTLYAGPAIPTGITLTKQDVRTVNGIVPNAAGNVAVSGVADTFAPLPYAATLAVDFNTETVRTLAATGNVAYGPSLNVAVLKTKRHYITNTTGADIALSFPAGWKFAPSRPATLAAGKEAILTLECLGTTDSFVKAAYAVLN